MLKQPLLSSTSLLLSPAIALGTLLLPQDFKTYTTRSASNISRRKKKQDKLRMTAENGPDYGEMGYWEARYKKEKGSFFEWFHGYSTLSPLLNSKVDKKDKVMILGCGNSRLGEEMHKDGFTDVINIDFSKEVINNMKEQAVGPTPGLQYLLMDARRLEFSSNSLRLVIDKGTTDAVLCGENYEYNVTKILSEISRCLVPGGLYLVVTYGDPDSRLEYFDRVEYNWGVEQSIISTEDGKNFHYVYSMTKKIDK